MRFWHRSCLGKKNKEFIHAGSYSWFAMRDFVGKNNDSVTHNFVNILYAERARCGVCLANVYANERQPNTVFQAQPIRCCSVFGVTSRSHRLAQLYRYMNSFTAFFTVVIAMSHTCERTCRWKRKGFFHAKLVCRLFRKDRVTTIRKCEMVRAFLSAFLQTRYRLHHYSQHYSSFVTIHWLWTGV